MWPSIQSWINENWVPIAIVIAVAILTRRFGTMVVGKIIRRAVRYRAHGDVNEEDVKKRQDTLISMLSTVLVVLVWLVAGFTILRRFGIDLTPLLAGASVLGVALGFGAQSIIKDFLSGLFIILENQYRVGDVVNLDGSDGRVEQITIRSTVVRDNDGSVHYIPNGTIAHSINRTMGFARLNLAIQVAPDTDVDKLAELINEIGAKIADEEKWRGKIIEAPHFQSISNFTPTTLEVKIAGKTQPSAQWNVTGEVRRRLLNALNKKGDSLKAAEPTKESKAKEKPEKPKAEPKKK
ncbi:MAG TPA: mechanosensitive ion channel family protein [Candidatus Saccharimonadales bacterium]|nr:mechanosensitive ion channel family protein [Candidatus Saccharimonadales bacterium]